MTERSDSGNGRGAAGAPPRFDPDALRGFAAGVLERVGMPRDKAVVVAEGLVEADLYGHTTHGLALLPEYAEEVESGEMAVDGEPGIVASRGASACWDARRLPGIWVTARAVAEACARAEELGTGAVAIRRSHHIGCLASFIEAPAGGATSCSCSRRIRATPWSRPSGGRPR